MHIKIPPPLVTVIFAFLMWAVSRAWPMFTFALPAKDVLAILIAIIGAVVCGMGVISFLRARTTLNPIKPSQASVLVVKGIYRHTRNPMYLGFLLELIAWGLYLSHVLVLLLVPTLFVAYMTRFQIVPEEHALELVFGKAYQVYKSEVRRWL